MSTNEQAPQDWAELKGKIKSKWSKFTDMELDGFQGKMDLISEKIQTVYGVTKAKADEEYREFRTGLEKKAAEVKATPKN